MYLNKTPCFCVRHPAYRAAEEQTRNRWTISLICQNWLGHHHSFRKPMQPRIKKNARMPTGERPNPCPMGHKLELTRLPAPRHTQHATLEGIFSEKYQGLTSRGKRANTRAHIDRSVLVTKTSREPGAHQETWQNIENPSNTWINTGEHSTIFNSVLTKAFRNGQNEHVRPGTKNTTFSAVCYVGV